MNKLYNFLTKPFKENLSLLFWLFILSSSVDLYYWISQSSYQYALYLLLHNFLLTYILVLPVEILNKRINIIYKSILLVTSFVIFLFNSYCVITLHSHLYIDIIAIVGGTNTQEAMEYMESSISTNYISSVLSLLLSFLALSFILRFAKPHIGKKVKITGLTLVILSILATIYNPSIYKDSFVGELQAFMQIPKSPNLKDYLQHPKIEFTEKEQPANIVMIIGESFTKSHSSLYGYDKETNPLLSSLKEKKLLFTFDSVRSAMTSTIKSFQTIMSTYKSELEDSCKWYECVTLPEIVKLSGYFTYWVSNQSKAGLHDNIVGRYSELCDSSYFTGDKLSGIRRTNLDEEVFDLLYPLIKDTTNCGKNFYIIHLMGSHTSFHQRYPSRFDRFKADQYTNYPKNQKQILAEYDNALLYNDSIVYELMNLYSDKEAVVLYFPDHGIDLFDTSDTYYGHAKTTEPLSVKAGTNIPFMIYTSPLYKEKFKKKVEQIEKNISRPYKTDDVIYTVMDIIGVRFKDNDNVSRYSLLSENPPATPNSESMAATLKRHNQGL